MVDASGQSLAYFYARENDNDAGTAGVLTIDEARRWRATSPSCQRYSVGSEASASVGALLLGGMAYRLGRIS